MVEFGIIVDVQEWDKSCEHTSRITDELNAWHVSFSLDDFWKTGVKFDSMVIYGLQWEPEEFLQAALDVKHPMDATKALPDELVSAVEH